MLLEILDVFRKAAVAIVESGVDTLGIVGKAVFEALGILRTGSAGPTEQLITMLLFGGALYLAYKLFWDSAKTIFYFVAILSILLLVFFAAFV